MCIEHATVLQAGLMMYVNVKQVIQFIISVMSGSFEGKGCWVQASYTLTKSITFLAQVN